MKKAYSIVVLLLALVPFLLIAGCSVPASEEEVKEIGAKASLMIVGSYGLYNDPALQAYVVSVGKRVEDASGYSEEPIKYTILDSPQIDHFSVPGGNIFITRGLLLRANSEAELAFVLAHEIGHLSEKHAMMRLIEKRKEEGVGNFGARMFGQVTGVAEITTTYMVFDYYPEHELAADKSGVEVMAGAGYNPKAAVSLLKTFARISERPGKHIIRNYNSTHASADVRIKEIEKLFKAAPSLIDDKKLVLNKENYIGMLKNLVVGESAESGIVDHGVYKNKAYMFALKKPKELSFVFGRRHLAGFNMKHDVFRVSAEKPGQGETIKGYAVAYARYLTEDENYSPDLSETGILGLPALKAERGSSYQDGRTTKMRFFEKNGIFYAFYYRHRSVNMFADYNKDFDELIEKYFSFLTVEQAKQIPELRLAIYKTVAGDTYEKVSTKFYGDESLAANIKIYNGIFSTPTAGILLKIPPKAEIKNI